MDEGFHAPRTLEEAAGLLASLETPVLIAGGQAVVPALQAGRVPAKHLVSTHRIDALRGVSLRDGQLRVGAGETHGALATCSVTHAHLPALANLAAGVGDPQVRARGTIGGALVAEPLQTDYSAALCALDGTIETTERTIPANAWPGDGGLEPHEIVLSVSFPLPVAAAYAKIAHPAGNHAEASLFAARFQDNIVRLACLGEAPGPRRLGHLEAALTEGREGGEAVLQTLLGKEGCEAFFAARLAHLFGEVWPQVSGR